MSWARLAYFAEELGPLVDNAEELIGGRELLKMGAEPTEPAD